MSYYISLGAGKHQLPLIKEAKNLGFRVIAIDSSIEKVGFSYADIKIEESIFNYRKIYYYILQRIPLEDIAGGFCASYGKALLSFSYLAEKFKIPFPSRTLLELLLNKYRTRKALIPLEKEIASFCQPTFFLKEELPSSFPLPLIAKPVGGHAKEGIKFIKSREQISSLPPYYLLEEFIPGEEIITVGLVENFSYHWVSMSDKKSTSYPPFLDIRHTYPSKWEGKFRPILQEILEKIVLHLQIPLGPIVAEWKIHEEKLYLMEISYQIPGEFLGEILIPEGAGYLFFRNLFLLLRKLVVPEKVDFELNLLMRSARS